MNPVKQIRFFEIIMALFGLGTIGLVILKLFKIITWAWIWVTCPLWSLIILLALILIFIILFAKNEYEEHCNEQEGK